ncbi:MAG: aminopeptidase P family protein [Abditibacteriaceae bacterium]
MNYTKRLQQLQRSLPRESDAIFISHLVNVRYLCGFTGTAGALLITRDMAHFLTDSRYSAQAVQQVPDDYEVHINNKNPWHCIAPLLPKSAKALAFESEHTSVATAEDAASKIKKIHLLPERELVEKLRSIKDEDELALIRRAANVADQCFDYICGELRPGLREDEVSLMMENFMRKHGASGPSFTFIVASGDRSALPHGVASSKVLSSGDLVTLDIGAIVDGYCSDLTRTVCLGKATAKQKNIYRTVWDAQTKALQAIKAGARCTAVDKVARDIIADAGYGENFGHGLGHGVGIDIHEQPRLSPLGKGTLKENMVVTCEPGIYIDGWGGVRIEDLIVVGKNGPKVLSHCAKPAKIMEL